MILPIEIMIGSSDIIVIGTIQTVYENTYDFEIQKNIKGNEKKIVIPVQKFKEWTCDTRIKKVEKGQHLLLFLKKKINNRYEIINGSTGELFIDNNKVRIHNKKITIEQFESTTQDFLLCYEFTNKNNPYKKGTFKSLKKQKEINVYKNKSSFSTWLFSRMKEYEITEN